LPNHSPTNQLPVSQVVNWSTRGMFEENWD